MLFAFFLFSPNSCFTGSLMRNILVQKPRIQFSHRNTHKSWQLQFHAFKRFWSQGFKNWNSICMFVFLKRGRSKLLPKRHIYLPPHFCLSTQQTLHCTLSTERGKKIFQVSKFHFSNLQKAE